MKKYIFAVLLVFTPSFAFADDGQIRSNILARLLDTFVTQVNTIDYILQQTAQAQDKTQFSTFKDLVQNQLSATTQQITILLNPVQGAQFGSIQPTIVPPIQIESPVPAPNFGTIIPPMPIDKSALEITVTSQDPNGALPHGRFYFSVSVLDTNGVSVKNADVSYQVPADNDSGAYWNSMTEAQTSSKDSAGKFVTPSFNYVPTIQGEKTIIFMSGNLNKSVVVEAQ